LNKAQCTSSYFGLNVSIWALSAALDLTGSDFYNMQPLSTQNAPECQI